MCQNRDRGTTAVPHLAKVTACVRGGDGDHEAPWCVEVDNRGDRHPLALDVHAGQRFLGGEAGFIVHRPVEAERCHTHK